MSLSPALSPAVAPPQSHGAFAPPTIESVPRAGLVLALLAPVATGAILVAKGATLSSIVGAPAIALGVVAATSPALYIALAATGDAPGLAQVARAMTVALAAFGIALCGLVLPAAFLALSSLAPLTAIAVVTVALGGAAALAMWRLAIELSLQRTAAQLVLAVWAISTLGIAGRLWIDLAREVLS